jgi:peptidoglycan/LPS O-acetylase OafA/YrhL
MLLALAIRRGWRAPWPTWIPAAGGACAYLTLVLFAPHDSEGKIPAILTDLVLLPFFIAVIAAAASADLRDDRTSLRAPSLVALGDRSFALYLIHLPLIKAVHAGVADWDLGGAATSAFAIGLLPASIYAAHLLYVAVERPAEQRLRRRLATSTTKS